MHATHNSQLTTANVKRATLIILTLLASFPMLADGLWGAKASLDINVPSKWKVGDFSTKMYNSGLGFSVGGVYSHYFTDGFFLEPSLSIFYDTYSADIILSENALQSSKPGIYKVGLRLPLTVGYTFDITDSFAISVFTGPELNYAFSGGYRLDQEWKAAVGDDVKLFGSQDGMQRRLSCSWKGGLAFPFGDWRFDLEAAVGISDIIVGPASVKENRVSLSLLRYF